MSTSNTPPPDSPLPSALPPTALLVEDDSLVLELYGSMLERLGFGVHSAADGDEALTLFENLEMPPSWVMLDLMLPGLSGLELLDRLRRELPHLPAVVVSGHAEFDVPDEGPARTIFLAKPFQLGDLSAAITRALGEKPWVREADG